MFLSLEQAEMVPNTLLYFGMDDKKLESSIKDFLSMEWEAFPFGSFILICDRIYVNKSVLHSCHKTFSILWNIFNIMLLSLYVLVW